MAGPTSLQSGLKTRLQCMLEYIYIQQFHFAANNIPENPASGMSGLIFWRDGGFPEVVHYYRGILPKNESFQI